EPGRSGRAREAVSFSREFALRRAVRKGGPSSFPDLMADPPESPLAWTEDGLPRSRRFGAVYFSSDDGLAETRAVFLDGCGLPDAWAGRRRFVVGELGFGTGLNIAALLDLWRRTRPPGSRLHVYSVEAF